MSKKLFTTEQEEFIKNNCLTMSYQEIGDCLGFSKKQISTWIYRYKIKKPKERGEKYFEYINTPLKAYFLGLIYADGTISAKKGRWRFCLALQSQDKYVLDKLNQELGGEYKIEHRLPKQYFYNNKIINTSDVDALTVYSKEFVKNLVAQNIVPNKTHSDIFPIIDDEYFFDYLRGYIDGDGCFYISKDNLLVTTIVCNSRKNLEYIQSVLLRYDIQTFIDPKKNSYILRCSRKKDNEKLLNRLYYEDGLFCLQRKYDKIKHLLGSAA